MLQSLGLLILLGLCAHSSSAASLDQELKHVSTSTSYVWGVTVNNEVFFCSKPCEHWISYGGTHDIEYLDVDETEVWSISSDGNLFKRPVDGTGAWAMVSTPGTMLSVSASGNGYIWATTTDHKIFNCQKPCNNGRWNQVPGGLKQIDAGQSTVYGVAYDDTIWARSVDGSGDWRQVPGGLDYITVSGTSGHIFGIAGSGSVWHCSEPCYGSWTGWPARLQQCDVAGNELFGTTDDFVKYVQWILIP